MTSPCSKYCILRSSLPRTSAGPGNFSAYARKALRMRPMMTAALSPEPATSPTTRPSAPDGNPNTSYQSPPTRPDPGTYRAAISAPRTAGSAEGTRLRCRAIAAAWFSPDRSDCTASAAVQQDRVEHIAGFDVTEDDRPPLGSDAARETLADRNPDALADFFLQAARRSGGSALLRGVVGPRAADCFCRPGPDGPADVCGPGPRLLSGHRDR